MTDLDDRAAEFQALIRDIRNQFKTVNEAAACGPWAELSLQELRVVEQLGGEGPQMMREVSEYLKLAVNSVTGIVDGLEKKDVVRRHRCPNDRRVVRVELTETGRRAYAVSAEMHAKYFRSILATLTDAEQQIFMLLFRKIARAGRSQISQLPINTVEHDG